MNKIKSNKLEINNKFLEFNKNNYINFSKSAIRYLNNYSEQEALPVNLNYFLNLPKFYYNSALIIPAFKEDISLLDNLKSLPFINNNKNNKNNKILVILIINAPDNASITDINTNTKLIKYINQNIPKISNITNNISNYKLTKHHDLLVINKIIPAKQGVGLARKIANDIAFTLFTYQIISSPWVYQTDADTTLPENYFDYIPKQISSKNFKNTAAAIFPFKHIYDKNNIKLTNAINIYENYLNNYVEKLKEANSPYAFHTLGSILAINAEHYAQSAGFPKLAAGEDFYLLNKLAKIGKIVSLEIINQPIYIQARISNRTPFGTGPALDKIIDNSNNSQNQDILKKYEPLKTMAIDALKIVIKIFNSPPENKKIKQILDNYITHNIYLQTCINNLNNKNYPIWQVLKDLGIEQWITKLPKNSTQKQLTQRYHQWFDGLKTLQFVKNISNL